jgi:hypothetical protein
VRISIVGSMVAICLIAIGIAALRDANERWTGALLLITLAVLACSAFGLAYHRGAARASWFGFAVFGWGYLSLTFGPYSPRDVRLMLPTTQALVHLHARLRPGGRSVLTTVIPPTGKSGMMDVFFQEAKLTSEPLIPSPSPAGSYVYMERMASVGDNFDHFLRVGHCLFALLAGLLGALIARRFHRGAACSEP